MEEYEAPAHEQDEEFYHSAKKIAEEANLELATGLEDFEQGGGEDCGIPLKRLDDIGSWRGRAGLGD